MTSVPDPAFPAFLYSKPGLRERRRPSRSVHFPQGQQSRNRESIALEENDLGDLRRGPRLDCQPYRRGLPHTTFPEAEPLPEGLPEGKLVYGTSRFGVLGGDISHVGVG